MKSLVKACWQERQDVEQMVDLGLRDDERRRKRHDVARRAHQHALLERGNEAVIRPLCRRIRYRRELDGSDKADVADIDRVGHLAQRVEPFFPIGR